MYSISVVVPVYNEEENIEKAILEINDFLSKHFLDYEIVLVDDGSKDNSLMIIQFLTSQINNIKLVIHTNNLGYGAALKSGFKTCTKELIFFTDSDRQFNINNLELMLPYIDKYQIVVGYRKIRSDNLTRRLLSMGYNILIQIVFRLNVVDIDCAFKLFRKVVLDAIEIESQRYSVNTEMLTKMKALNFSIYQMAVDHFPRLGNYSKIGFKDIPRTLTEIFRIWKSLNKQRDVRLS